MLQPGQMADLVKRLPAESLDQSWRGLPRCSEACGRHDCPLSPRCRLAEYMRSAGGREIMSRQAENPLTRLLRIVADEHIDEVVRGRLERLACPGASGRLRRLQRLRSLPRSPKGSFIERDRKTDQRAEPLRERCSDLYPDRSVTDRHNPQSPRPSHSWIP